jgi:hypothetical protein
MKTTAIPPLSSIDRPAFASDILPLRGATDLATFDDGQRSSRSVSNFFRAVRAFLSRLTDCSAYQDVSSGREISVVFTPNGPLIYRWESNKGKPPFFVFTLPAGALADSVNRKTLLCAINLWLAAAAVALSILGWLHLLNPCRILISVFLLGGGFALNAPTWTSIVPQVVSTSELGSAATLGGLQFNISGTIGPALGGLLVGDPERRRQWPLIRIYPQLNAE